MSERMPVHHQQGELEFPKKDHYVQGELFASAHTLLKLSSTEVVVVTKKEAKQDELDLFPEIQHLF